MLPAAGLRVGTDAGAHAEVLQLLRASTDPRVHNAADRLGFLRHIRNMADYGVGLSSSGKFKFDLSQSQKSVTSAAIIIRQLRRVQREDRRLRIPPGIN